LEALTALISHTLDSPSRLSIIFLSLSVKAQVPVKVVLMLLLITVPSLLNSIVSVVP
jgi:hypothetical protein